LPMMGFPDAVCCPEIAKEFDPIPGPSPWAGGGRWTPLPQRHPACSRYQALPAAGQAKRARWIADAKLQCYRK